MESADRLHKQIEGLEELRSIVKTMKALSAASIRQYEQAVEALDAYHHTVELGLQALLRDIGGVPRPQGRAPATRAAIVFGSDHGLCGRFNEDIASQVLARLHANAPGSSTNRVLAVGARLAAALEQQDLFVEETFFVPGSAVQITTTVQQILIKVDEWRAEDAGIHVDLHYNRHTDRTAHEPTCVALLPVDQGRLGRLVTEPWPSRRLPVFTMERDVLLSRFLNQYFFVSVFRACAESQASEHASRLAAMQSAQGNLDERLEAVLLAYRRARQDAITSELLDVVAGFEAITTSSD